MGIGELYRKSLLNFGLLVIRIALGIYMLRTSSSYLFEGKMGELIGFLDSLNWPLPEFLATLSQWVELVAAIFVLLGVRFAALIMAFTLMVAVVFAHGGRIFEEALLPFMLAISFLGLGMIGSGRFSLDFYLFRRK